MSGSGTASVDDLRELEGEALAAWRAVDTVYSAFMDRDEPRLVSKIADEATLWDSAHREPRIGVEMKRTARDASAWGPTTVLESSGVRVDVWGDTALVTHDLAARFADPTQNEDLRVTAVLRRVDGAWLIVHHHEEKLLL